MHALSIKNLSFCIQGKQIIKDISLDIRDNEHISIIGPNGAGKSTLLKLLAQIYRPTHGNIELYGTNVRTLSAKTRAQLVSYVPQSNDPSITYNVFDFVLMSRYAHLSPFSSIKKSDRDVVEDALHLTRCSEFKHSKLCNLSGGQRQKVLIASALAQQSKMMLLDEPTTYLDPHHCDEILSLLQEIQRTKGTTIISVTHDINHAALTSNSIIALKNGSVSFYGTPEDCFKPKVLEAIYDQQFTLVQHPTRNVTMALPS